MPKTPSIDERIERWESSGGIAILNYGDFIEHFKRSEFIKIKEESAIYHLESPGLSNKMKNYAFTHIRDEGSKINARIAVITREIKNDKPNSIYDFTVYFYVKKNAVNRRLYEKS